MFPNYADQKKPKDMMMPDMAQGKAPSPQRGAGWRDYLPQILKGFQGAGLIGAGVGLAGAMAKKKRPFGMGME